MAHQQQQQLMGAMGAAVVAVVAMAVVLALPCLMWRLFCAPVTTLCALWMCLWRRRMGVLQQQQEQQ